MFQAWLPSGEVSMNQRFCGLDFSNRQPTVACLLFNLLQDHTRYFSTRVSEGILEIHIQKTAESSNPNQSWPHLTDNKYLSPLSLEKGLSEIQLEVLGQSECFQGAQERRAGHRETLIFLIMKEKSKYFSCSACLARVKLVSVEIRLLEKTRKQSIPDNRDFSGSEYSIQTLSSLSTFLSRYRPN